MCHWTPRGKNKWFLTPAPEGAKELNNFFHKNEQKIERISIGHFRGPYK